MISSVLAKMFIPDHFLCSCPEVYDLRIDDFLCSTKALRHDAFLCSYSDVLLVGKMTSSVHVKMFVPDYFICSCPNIYAPMPADFLCLVQM